MSDPGACFLCAKEGRTCDKGRPCSNCRARGTPQMCVGSELTGRTFSSYSTPVSSGTKSRNPKSTSSISSKPPLKQITGPEAPPSAPLALTPETSSGKASVNTIQSSAISTPLPATSSLSTPTAGAGNDPTLHLSSGPGTPFIGELSSQMDSVTLRHASASMDISEDNGIGRDVVFPSSSPPPETYMDIQPKRPRKKRDRYPETQTTHSAQTTQWQDQDLAPARIPSSHPTKIEMMREIQQLRQELENAKRQNDTLNLKMMRMAENAHVLNQLQQYMTHLKIGLPDGANQTKDVVVGAPSAQTTAKALSVSELKNLSPYAAFRDACVRYPGLSIVLFDLSTPIPVVILANDAFNSLFATDAVTKPWVTFIAPAYLQRTKMLLNTASQHCAAMKFVQVYQDANQNQFVALDIHRFFATTSSTTGARTFMDLVFLMQLSHLPYPTTEDLTYGQVSVNEFGQVDVSQLFSTMHTGPSFAPAAHHGSISRSNTLSSSGGISFHPDFYDVQFGDPVGTHSSRFDDISSPSVVEVTTPPQDLLPNPLGFSGEGAKISASPLEHSAWFPSNDPWTSEPMAHSGWDPNFAWNPLTGSVGIVGAIIPPATSGGAMVEELTSPTTPTQSPNSKASPKMSSAYSSPHSNHATSNRDPSPHETGSSGLLSSMHTSSDTILPLPAPFDGLDILEHI